MADILLFALIFVCLMFSRARSAHRDQGYRRFTRLGRSRRFRRWPSLLQTHLTKLPPMGWVPAKPDVRQKPIQFVARYRLLSFVPPKSLASAIVQTLHGTRVAVRMHLLIRFRTAHRIVIAAARPVPFVAHL